MNLKIMFGLGLSVALATTTAISKNHQPVKNLLVDKPTANVFNFMHAHRQGGGCTVDWNTSATSSTVVCFDVIRTYEDPMDPYSEWTPVGNASCTTGKSYKVTEDPVSPGFVSYR